MVKVIFDQLVLNIMFDGEREFPGRFGTGDRCAPFSFKTKFSSEPLGKKKLSRVIEMERSKPN